MATSRPLQPAPRTDADGKLTFAPTMREVLLSPRWLAMLLIALVVAGVFAWLGQWQLERAIGLAPDSEQSTEEIVAISEVTEPGRYLGEPLVGQRVRTSGAWVPGDFLVVSPRIDEGVTGAWVVGHFRLSEAEAAKFYPGENRAVSLAVAAGWAPSVAEAETVAAALNTESSFDEMSISGRLIADEGPALPTGSDVWEISRVSPALLLSRWDASDDPAVFRQYLTMAEPVAGLSVIHSPPPAAISPVNWLNLFYAAEWVVFAGFAFYMWYRLARDDWEKRLEAFEDENELDPS